VSIPLSNGSYVDLLLELDIELDGLFILINCLALKKIYLNETLNMKGLVYLEKSLMNKKLFPSVLPKGLNRTKIRITS
jgi:hypothetical protein